MCDTYKKYEVVNDESSKRQWYQTHTVYILYDAVYPTNLQTTPHSSPVFNDLLVSTDLGLLAVALFSILGYNPLRYIDSIVQKYENTYSVRVNIRISVTIQHINQ